MPTYDYECNKCNLTYEHFQSMKDEPLARCIHPEGCKHPKSRAKPRRLLGTGAGIIFKGSGFYETDYRSNEYKESAKKDREASNPSTTTASDKSGKSGDSSSSSGKSESKSSASSGSGSTTKSSAKSKAK